MAALSDAQYQQGLLGRHEFQPARQPLPSTTIPSPVRDTAAYRKSSHLLRLGPIQLDVRFRRGRWWRPGWRRLLWFGGRPFLGRLRFGYQAFRECLRHGLSYLQELCQYANLVPYTYSSGVQFRVRLDQDLPVFDLARIPRGDDRQGFVGPGYGTDKIRRLLRRRRHRGCLLSGGKRLDLLTPRLFFGLLRACTPGQGSDQQATNQGRKYRRMDREPHLSPHAPFLRVSRYCFAPSFFGFTWIARSTDSSRSGRASPASSEPSPG
jgi:hypothetical protein